MGLRTYTLGPDAPPPPPRTDAEAGVPPGSLCSHLSLLMNISTLKTGWPDDLWMDDLCLGHLSASFLLSCAITSEMWSGFCQGLRDEGQFQHLAEQMATANHILVFTVLKNGLTVPTSLDCPFRPFYLSLSYCSLCPLFLLFPGCHIGNSCKLFHVGQFLS